ncbi:MAG TPA: SDR family oxidoreductase, partial [Steroidobacteraceae bacterium]|nr:SDR family oxidoreductase [Steroidobacteraceae bacterium]
MADVHLPKCVSETWDSYVLHPSVMDGALQASIGLWLASEKHSPRGVAIAPLLPFALAQLEILDRIPASICVVVRAAKAVQEDTNTRKVDIDICDLSGRVCVRLLGLISRVLQRQGAAKQAGKATDRLMLLRPSWKSKPLTSQPGSTVKYGKRWVWLDHIYKECISDLEAQHPGISCAALPARRTNSIAEQVAAVGEQIFECVREALKTKPNEPVLVQDVVAVDSDGSPLADGVGALLKSACQENPKVLGQVITVPQILLASELSLVLSENASREGHEDVEIHYQSGTREVVCYEELDESSTLETSRTDVTVNITQPWRDGGVYLITGGAGGLGMIVAREIAGAVKGAKIVLAGRRSLNADRQTEIAALVNAHRSSTHACIEYRTLDVSDATAVTQAVHAIVEQYGSVNGIVHCAGVIRDNFIIRKSTEEFRAVLAPKILGTENLDRATADISLDFFISFSSIAGCLGNIGQSDYSFANAFLDRYAAYRQRLVRDHRRSGRTLSINWPLWADGGMRI